MKPLRSNKFVGSESSDKTVLVEPSEDEPSRGRAVEPARRQRTGALIIRGQSLGLMLSCRH
jgi:hypothetical protein